MILFHLSWASFGCLLAIVLIIYYAVILHNYCSEEVKRLLNKPKRPASVPDEEPASLAGSIAPEPGASQGSLDELMQGSLPDCLEELKWFFNQAAHDRVPRAEIPVMLRPLLEPYEHLLASGFLSPIREHILAECQAELGYELTEKEPAKCLPKSGSFPAGKLIALAGLAMLLAQFAQAQDGNQGIQQATTMVQGYFSTGCTLMYAIGAVIAIIGGIKTFQKWNAGEPDTTKVAAAWFGSCIFLVVVATVIKSFFGL